MSLVTTTVATGAPIGVSDVEIKVTSATSVAAGRVLVVDQEVMKVRKNYVTGSTLVPVLRGQHGSASLAHQAGANVTHGDPSDFDNPPAQASTAYPVAGRSQILTSYTASGAITLPNAGEDVIAVLNGTSVLAMTVAAPGKDIDGCKLFIQGNGAAAHTVTFANGLSGAGSSYDVLTVNATAPVLLGPFMAVNGLWQAPVGVAMAGTVTNITATLS